MDDKFICPVCNKVFKKDKHYQNILTAMNDILLFNDKEIVDMCSSCNCFIYKDKKIVD